jgi:ATP-dependent DNA helicase RecG
MKNELLEKLYELMKLPAETEWVEFKEAKNNFDFDELGRYFSALSNEANLKRQHAGWLIFGVTDRPPRQIVGSNYRHQKPGLEKLKREISKHTNHQTTYNDIVELIVDGQRVILFQIPPAPRGVPTTWQGVAYGRVHDSLGPLNLQKIEAIRRQAMEDWSAGILENASIDNLDPEAIALARQNYAEKNPKIVKEAANWDDATFLNKAKACISGGITRAALMLLGKNEAEHLLSPAVTRITWLLRDERGIEKDYAHFGPPLLLAVERAFSKIRNLTYRHLPSGQLFPIEISQYDPWVIRESLHNCIAHQD